MYFDNKINFNQLKLISLLENVLSLGYTSELSNLIVDNNTMYKSLFGNLTP